MFFVCFAAALALLWAGVVLTAFCPVRGARRRADLRAAESDCPEAR